MITLRLISEDLSSVYLMLLVCDLSFSSQDLHFFLKCSFFSSLFYFEGLCLSFVSWRVLWVTCYFWRFCFLFSRVCFCSWLIPAGTGLRCLVPHVLHYFLIVNSCSLELYLRILWGLDGSHILPERMCVYFYQKPGDTTNPDSLKTKCSAVAFGVP